VSVEPPKPQGTPSPPFIATAPALEALALLDRGLGARAPFVVVTGEPGVGKSTLVREALRRWGARVHARRLSPGDATAETLFATLLERLGGTTNSQATGPAIAQRLVEAIAHAASAGKVVMVVMEDAHVAAPELLLQLANVAEMARRKPCAFEVMLVGTPELSARLGEPALSLLTEKLATQVKLSQLTQHDTRHYLLQRSGATGATASGMFSRKACRDIHGATFGVPRAIEALADESARRAAKAGATTISPEHVRSATQALRARRSSATASASMPRPERVIAAPTENAAAQEQASAAPARPANAASPKPVNGRPAGANGTPRGTETAKREAPGATSTTGGDTKPPKASEQRVKDWVSRFGGSTGVRIGASHSIPRYEASATLDVPAPSPARPTVPAREGAAPVADGGATPAKARKLIVDEEPPFPPELVARINKLTTKRRRRGPGTTIQGAALALSVALLVVVLARQAGFGKHLGIDSADTGARQVSAVTPAPPLELGTGGEPRRPVSHRATSPSAGTTGQHKRPKLILTPTEPAKPEPSSRPKPTPKKSVATTQAQSPAPPALPNPSTTSASATTSAPTTGADQSPTNPHQKFAIVAGSFQSNDMAKAEKDHLARLVQYRVWVNKSKVEGKRSYQLMVGRFDSMEHAWDAGQSLMRRGLIRDANVQPLPE
jgi:type II secretory pathway predicted ATPase ExeA